MARRTDPDYVALIESSRQYANRQRERWEKSVKMYKGEITDFRRLKLKTWA